MTTNNNPQKTKIYPENGELPEATPLERYVLVPIVLSVVLVFSFWCLSGQATQWLINHGVYSQRY